MTTEILAKLKELAQMKYAFITKRANHSILLPLKIAKANGYETVYIQESGGWITYDQFARKLKLSIEQIPTQNEELILTNLKLNSKSIILIHSLAGYHKTIDTTKLRTLADAQGALFIEDMCGTFGNTKPNGHIILGSFGNAKPLSVGAGGFIATNDALVIKPKHHAAIF